MPESGVPQKKCSFPYMQIVRSHFPMTLSKQRASVSLLSSAPHWKCDRCRHPQGFCLPYIPRIVQVPRNYDFYGRLRACRWNKYSSGAPECEQRITYCNCCSLFKLCFFQIPGTQLTQSFNGVDPSDVGNQRGWFAEAFAEHEGKFTSTGDKKMVTQWKADLKKVSKLSGWHLKNFKQASTNNVLAHV
ncbi:hypothetical protein DVH24_009419 [Malus domestica]|uniref:TIR domain-containing protein n=1 Tax=Malus domestica TaxID=3750 RepID=A0A498IQ33_MALDO|nr:hypothetical protein DVH24_009419 [Malus domestica]